MDTVVSEDGTTIAFDRTGEGPVVILVGGALSTRESAAPLAAELAPRLSVVAYDRRGRGGSSDTPPYAVAREIEDLAALIETVGGSAFVLGHASGAALALEAAAEGLPIGRLALYEPPFIVGDLRAPVPPDYPERLRALLRAERKGDAVALFLTEAAGLSPEQVAHMRAASFWAATEAVAHTLLYDAAIMGENMHGGNFPPRTFAGVHVPALVLDGGASPAWARHAVQAVANALPLGERRTLPGQDHSADPDVLAPVLVDFFTN